MRQFFRLSLVLCAFSALSVAQFGCSSAEVDENDPAALMKDAEEDIQSSHYLLAIEKLQKIKNKHPYSKQATEAALRLGDVYFMQESFIEAAATYEAFVDLHPKHEKIPYAMYRVGLSHYNDAPTEIARDLTPLAKAETAFKNYLEKFPNSEYSVDSKAKLLEVRGRLAEKELYIANFYYKREMWEAAKGRFQKILNQFPDTAPANEATVKLKKIEEMPADASSS